MAAMWCVAFLAVLASLWTLSRADVIRESNATTISPVTTLNVTVSSVQGATSVAAIIGRVAVALCVAGTVGVIVYCLKKKCPRGSTEDERQPVVDRRRAKEEETRPLNKSATSNTVGQH